MTHASGLLASSNPLDHVVQHPIWTVQIGGWDFTLFSDQIAMVITAAVLLLWLVPRAVKSYGAGQTSDELTPRGFLNFIETICDYLRREVAQPALHEHTDRFIKYIWTVFFFILTMNILGLLPIAAITPLFGVHLGGTATANIWLTAAMATATLFMMVFNGLKYGGIDYLAHFCPGPLLLKPLMVVIEVIGLFAKNFALAVRLFVNMMGGHILLAVLLSFILSAGSALGAAGGLLVAIPVILGSVAIYMLEIFVAFLQAFIFTFLTTLFIGMSVVLHHDEGHGEAAHHH